MSDFSEVIVRLVRIALSKEPVAVRDADIAFLREGVDWRRADRGGVAI